MAGEILSLLHRTGWLGNPVNPTVNVASAPPNISDSALKQAFAEYVAYHLGAKYRADAQTAAYLLKAPRCSVPDHLCVVDAAGAPVENAVAKWPHLDLRFWRDGWGLIGFDSSTIDGIYRDAIESWAAVCGLRVSIVRSQVEANVFSLSGPIDGQGSTLALAYLPYVGISARDQLQQLFDHAERYLTREYLQEVIAHESGHSIGISHLKAGNLMAAYATGKVVVPQLGDVMEAVKRYGKPAPVPIPEPEPIPTPDDPASWGMVAFRALDGRIVELRVR